MGYNRLGYGSHSFLNEYILQNKCKKIMEIGVAKGDNAQTLVTVANRNFPADEVEYYGFDTFEGKDNSQLSQVKQKLQQTGCHFTLFKGDSTQTLPQALTTLPTMDLIFIDGGHAYPTVQSDWEHAKQLLHNKTAVFFHNYNFAGVKTVVDNIARDEYRVEIIHPPSDYATAFVKKNV